MSIGHQSAIPNLFLKSSIIKALCCSLEKGKGTVTTCCLKYEVSLSGSKILVPVEACVLS